MKDERSRRYYSLMLERLQAAGQEPISKAMGVSEATVSRLKNEHLENFSEMLAHLGLKVVPQEMQCYKPESIASILHLAKERMEQLESPEQLQWGD